MEVPHNFQNILPHSDLSTFPIQFFFNSWNFSTQLQNSPAFSFLNFPFQIQFQSLEFFLSKCDLRFVKIYYKIYSKINLKVFLSYFICLPEITTNRIGDFDFIRLHVHSQSKPFCVSKMCTFGDHAKQKDDRNRKVYELFIFKGIPLTFFILHSNIFIQSSKN